MSFIVAVALVLTLGAVLAGLAALGYVAWRDRSFVSTFALVVMAYVGTAIIAGMVSLT